MDANTVTTYIHAIDTAILTNLVLFQPLKLWVECPEGITFRYKLRWFDDGSRPISDSLPVKHSPMVM